ncbi:MAG: hypothetical protein WCG25_08415 [bacterium]
MLPVHDVHILIQFLKIFHRHAIEIFTSTQISVQVSVTILEV